MPGFKLTSSQEGPGSSERLDLAKLHFGGARSAIAPRTGPS